MSTVSPHDYGRRRPAAKCIAIFAVASDYANELRMMVVCSRHNASKSIVITWQLSFPMIQKLTEAGRKEVRLHNDVRIGNYSLRKAKCGMHIDGLLSFAQFITACVVPRPTFSMMDEVA